MIARINKLVLIASVLIVSFYLGTTVLQKKVSNQTLVQKEDSEESRDYILIGDTGTAGDSQYQVADSIKNYCATKKCVAVFILGDVIYDNGVKSVDDPQFETKFENPYKGINLPFYILYGNHDYLGCRQCYLDYDKKSQKWKMPQRYYKLPFPGVTFYAIDTENFDSEQQKWLSSEIHNNDSTKSIVLGHKPLKSFEETKISENWAGKKELNQILCSTSDFYISGHAHLLEIPGKIDDCKVMQLISGSGGAYPRKVKKPYEGTFYYEGNGFLVLSVGKDVIKYDFYDKNGKLIY